jgi:hypothetical protein
MSLLLCAKPLLELTVCKEYCMARKTDGTTTSRKKKAAPPTETAALPPAPAPAVPVVLDAEVRGNVMSTGAIPTNVMPTNVTPINVATIKTAPRKTQPSSANPELNLDDEIRQRAYELFLERKGAAGDPAADWFVAEHEVRARRAGKETAFAARQGR